MNSGLRISEGMQATSRLSLHALRATPRIQDSPRVLLLGGSNFDLRLKRSFLDTPFAAACDIATYEPRGIGRSAQPEGPWTMQDYALDALAYLDALDWDEVTVVGESFGGMTALHLALLAPQRIKRIVIASATAGGPEHCSHDISRFLDLPPEEAARQALFILDTRNVTLSSENPEVFAQRLWERMRFEEAFADPSQVSGGYARLLTARRGHDCTQRLDDIDVPTTVIAGRFDRQAPFASQQALAERLSNCGFQAFDDGHGLLFGLPEATAAALNAVVR